jgi:probable HAF family extracellular repeat protein
MNKPKIIRLTFALASLVAVTIAFGQRPQLAVDIPTPPQLQYNVINLGDFLALGIDESGHIVGQTHFGADLHAVYWPNSHSPGVDLGNLPGFARSFATDLNPAGEIVGNVATGSFFRPVYWASSQSAPVELPGVPVGLAGAAVGINPVGQIVGYIGPAGFPSVQAVSWPNSNTALVYLPGFGNNLVNSAAFSINASGNILGFGCDADFVECHAAFWASSTSAPVALASPAGEFVYTSVNLVGRIPHAVNNAGGMVGYAYNANGSESRAVFWASSTSPAVILSTPTGEFMNGGAQAISDNGQIVGAAYNSDFSDFHAFVWPSSTSQGIDLNTMIPPDSGWELQFATDVNNRGEIVGAGIFNGTMHAYVLVPRIAPPPRPRPTPAPRP